MTTTPPALSVEAQRFNWLLDNFVRGTAGVTDAVAVSSDGILIARSSDMPRDRSEHVAALVSGLVSLGHGASRSFGFGPLQQVLVMLAGGTLFVSSMAAGGCLGVVATSASDIGMVGYQSGLLVERSGALLTPALIDELRQAVLG